MINIMEWGELITSEFILACMSGDPCCRCTCQCTNPDTFCSPAGNKSTDGAKEPPQL